MALPDPLVCAAVYLPALVLLHQHHRRLLHSPRAPSLLHQHHLRLLRLHHLHLLHQHHPRAAFQASIVDVQGKGEVSIDQLQICDKVRSSTGYSHVYSFAYAYADDRGFLDDDQT